MSKKKTRKKMKRENGKGSVYKLSGNRRKPWAAATTVGYDEDTGGQIRKIIGCFTEEDEAMIILLRYNELLFPLLEKGFTSLKIHEAISNIIKENQNDWEGLMEMLSVRTVLNILSPDKMIFSPVSEKTTVEELYEIIYSNGEKDGLGRAALYDIKSSYNAISSLKNDSLYDLTSMDFQFVIDGLIEDPSQASSFSKLSKIRSLINRMYNILIQHKVMTVNHAQFISLRGKKDGDVPPFPESDIEILFKNDKNRIAKSSLILAYTGLRISEFLELRKSLNVDMERWLIVGGNKTDAGKDRAIAIHLKIRKYITYFFNEFPESDMLFSRTGEIVSPNYYRRYYHNPLVKELGLSELNPHSFRHTAASKMRMAGLDDKAIINMIGHTSINFTDKRYVDVDDNYLHEQIGKIQ